MKPLWVVVHVHDPHRQSGSWDHVGPHVTSITFEPEPIFRAPEIYSWRVTDPGSAGWLARLRRAVEARR